MIIAKHREHPLDGDALGVHRHQDLRLLLVLRRLRIGLAHQDRDLAAGIADARRPPFAAVDDVVVAIALNALIAGMFILFGVFAHKGHLWSFVVGMILYALDGLIFAIASDWLAAGFHVFVLYWLFNGFRAARQLQQL